MTAPTPADEAARQAEAAAIRKAAQAGPEGQVAAVRKAARDLSRKQDEQSTRVIR